MEKQGKGEQPDKEHLERYLECATGKSAQAKPAGTKL